jgi:hypothetical protein
MLTGTFTVQTAASAQDVLAYLADFRHQTEWREDVLSCDLDSGNAGADGTVYRQHVRQGPGTADRLLRATVDVENGAIDFETLGEAPILARGSSRVVATETGASIESSIQIAFSGAGLVLRPVVSREVRRRMPQYEAALTRRLDALARSSA